MGVVCLMFDLIIRLFEGPLLSPSLGKVFGKLRLLSGFLSLLGLWHGEESWPMIILLREGLRWSTSVVTCMCRCSGETVAHLLLYCDVSYVLWSKSLGVFGVQWVIPATIADLLFGWWNWLGKILPTFGMLFLCVLCGPCGRNKISILLKTRRGQ